MSQKISKKDVFLVPLFCLKLIIALFIFYLFSYLYNFIIYNLLKSFSVDHINNDIYLNSNLCPKFFVANCIFCFSFSIISFISSIILINIFYNIRIDKIKKMQGTNIKKEEFEIFMTNFKSSLLRFLGFIFIISKIVFYIACTYIFFKIAYTNLHIDTLTNIIINPNYTDPSIATEYQDIDTINLYLKMYADNRFFWKINGNFNFNSILNIDKKLIIYLVCFIFYSYIFNRFNDEYNYKYCKKCHMVNHILKNPFNNIFINAYLCENCGQQYVYFDYMKNHNDSSAISINHQDNSYSSKIQDQSIDLNNKNLKEKNQLSSKLNVNENKNNDKVIKFPAGTEIGYREATLGGMNMLRVDNTFGIRSYKLIDTSLLGNLTLEQFKRGEYVIMVGNKKLTIQDVHKLPPIKGALL